MTPNMVDLEEDFYDFEILDLKKQIEITRDRAEKEMLNQTFHAMRDELPAWVKGLNGLEPAPI